MFLCDRFETLCAGIKHELIANTTHWKCPLGRGERKTLLSRLPILFYNRTKNVVFHGINTKRYVETFNSLNSSNERFLMLCQFKSAVNYKTRCEKEFSNDYYYIRP